MLARDFLGSSPPATEAGSTSGDPPTSHAIAGGNNMPNPSAAEPSASDRSAPSRQMLETICEGVLPYLSVAQGNRFMETCRFTTTPGIRQCRRDQNLRVLQPYVCEAAACRRMVKYWQQRLDVSTADFHRSDELAHRVLIVDRGRTEVPWTETEAGEYYLALSLYLTQ